MFISELINGSFYFTAEQAPASSSSHHLRWSVVPHKPEPIKRVHFIQVPRRIRDQAENMFRDDSRRRYNEAQHDNGNGIARTLRRAAAGDIRVPVSVDSPAGSSQLHRSPVADCDATV